MSKTTTFENAKVGDKVWSIEYGFGNIIARYSEIIIVFFLSGKEEVYYTTGVKRSGSPTRSLFWDKVDIPTEPKRKVKKVVVGEEISFGSYDGYAIPYGILREGTNLGVGFLWQSLIGKKAKVTIEFEDVV